MIRKASKEDLEDLAKLFDEYRVFYKKSSDIEGAIQFLTERLKAQDSEIYVAQKDDVLVGFVQLFPIFSSTRMQRYWLLNDLYVNENFRGQGFSKALIEAAKDLCRISNSCGMLLETGKENIIGNQLYPACGFQKYDGVNFYEWTVK